MSFLNYLTPFILILILFSLMSVSLQPAAAQSFRQGFERVDQERRDQNISDFDGSFTEFILQVLRVATLVVGALVLGALIYGAVMYIISLGNDQRTETAKKIILYAIIGLLILGVSGIVVNVLINIIRS